jgi:hypothetical protein
MYSPYGFTLWDPTSLQCLLQCEIVKSGCIVADDCKITVGLGKMYNEKIILMYKIIVEALAM